MRIGILAVQGAFAEQEIMLNKLGVETILLRKKEDINNIDGLILPGGESTVQGKLIKELDMYDSLKSLISNGIPVLATCAGLILLSSQLSNDNNVYLGTLPVTVKRNAYGRQLGSFNAIGKVGELSDFKMSFIRAPIIEEVSDEVEILAKVDEQIVGVKYKNQIGLSFHPEIGIDTRIHELFLKQL